MKASIQAELRTIIDATLHGDLTKEQADRANDLGRKATNAVMLATSTGSGASVIIRTVIT